MILWALLVLLLGWWTPVGTLYETAGACQSARLQLPPAVSRCVPVPQDEDAILTSASEPDRCVTIETRVTAIGTWRDYVRVYHCGDQRCEETWSESDLTSRHRIRPAVTCRPWRWLDELLRNPPEDLAPPARLGPWPSIWTPTRGRAWSATGGCTTSGRSTVIRYTSTSLHTPCIFLRNKIPCISPPTNTQQTTQHAGIPPGGWGVWGGPQQRSFPS